MSERDGIVVCDSKKALYESLLHKARAAVALFLRKADKLHGGYSRVLTRYF